MSRSIRYQCCQSEASVVNQKSLYVNLVFPIVPRKNPTWQMMLRSYFLSGFAKLCSAVAEKKTKMSQPIRGQCSQSEANVTLLVFWLSRKTKLAEDFQILLPHKFRRILLSDCRRRISLRQRPGRPSWFSDRSENNTLVKGRCILLLVTLWCCREEFEMSQPIRGRGSPCYYPIGPKKKTQTL